MDPRLPRTGNARGASSEEARATAEGSGQRDLSSIDAGSESSRQARESHVATQVHALEVYEDAVQEPLLECSNLAGMYYGAQDIGSDRPEARILREDFCSSAIVAQTWLQLDRANQAQGVDIDLDALKIARGRVNAAKRADRKARIVQSAAYSPTQSTEVLGGDSHDDKESEIEQNSGALDEGVHTAELGGASDKQTSHDSTWAEGAASDRFERRFQARLAKEQARKATSSDAKGNGIGHPRPKEHINSPHALERDQHLVLLHADVLALPLEGTHGKVEAPDLVYAGNYALSYFHDRHTLLAYLRQCRRTLRKRTGVLIVDPFAGPTTWEASSDAERQEQKDLWARFGAEPGFLRSNDGLDPPSVLQGHPLEFWQPKRGAQPTPQGKEAAGSADWRSWPRGRLVLVRKGVVRNHTTGQLEDYEYWREDGPLDYATNRFRMSLSFRFVRDGSWLRDYFSYDFRVWSLKELTEAMEEVGFGRLGVHAIPRTTEAEKRGSRSLSRSSSSISSSSRDSSASRDFQKTDDVEDDVLPSSPDLGLDGMASLMRRTERHEKNKSTYKVLEEGQKVFAAKSFGSE